MKIKFITIIAFLLVFTANAQVKENVLQFKNFKQLQKFFTYSKKTYPLVSAHRGGPTNGFPENCTATFENTIAKYPAIIETDISLTKDSILVMFHDDKLDRLTNGTGKIGDFTHEELLKLQLKDKEGNVTNYKIQTLDSILKWGKNKVVYTLDVKRGVPYKMVVDAVKKHQAENYSIIITYNANQAAEVAKLHNKVLISVSAKKEEDVKRLQEFGVHLKNIVAFVGTSLPSDENIAYFQKQKIPMIIGTMGNIDKSAATNNEKPYIDILQKGIFILSSDRPLQVSEQIEIYLQNRQ
jgi:glycerophosphoryl diester phosphodiesterase